MALFWMPYTPPAVVKVVRAEEVSRNVTAGLVYFVWSALFTVAPNVAAVMTVWASTASGENNVAKPSAAHGQSAAGKLEQSGDNPTAS